MFGPFVAIVILALITLSAAFGVYTLVTLQAWWVLAAGGAILFAGYLIDRLMFYGVKVMGERNQIKRAKTEEVLKNLRTGNIPFIPRTDTDSTHPKGGSGTPPKGGIN
jgi:hypothetical protein